MQACSCYVGLSLEQNAARTGTVSVSLPVWGPVGLWPLWVGVGEQPKELDPLQQWQWN